MTSDFSLTLCNTYGEIQSNSSGLRLKDVSNQTKHRTFTEEIDVNVDLTWCLEVNGCYTRVYCTYITSDKLLQPWDLCLRHQCCTQKLWPSRTRGYFLHHVGLTDVTYVMFSFPEPNQWFCWLNHDNKGRMDDARGRLTIFKRQIFVSLLTSVSSKPFKTCW